MKLLDVDDETTTDPLSGPGKSIVTIDPLGLFEFHSASKLRLINTFQLDKTYK